MSTQPPDVHPASPTIPLTAEVKSAYKDLYDKIEAAIESSTDPAVLQPLNDWIEEVDDVLTRDDAYRLHATTELFQALLKQIKYTNSGLKTLESEITSVASHFAMAGSILAAISKVLTLIPGA